MNAWSGRTEDWNVPDKNRHLHEVMKRRRRFAPGNEDRSLQETRRGVNPRVWILLAPLPGYRFFSFQKSSSRRSSTRRGTDLRRFKIFLYDF